jgi:hypothetical protein
MLFDPIGQSTVTSGFPRIHHAPITSFGNVLVVRARRLCPFLKAMQYVDGFFELFKAARARPPLASANSLAAY